MDENDLGKVNFINDILLISYVHSLKLLQSVTRQEI